MSFMEQTIYRKDPTVQWVKYVYPLEYTRVDDFIQSQTGFISKTIVNETATTNTIEIVFDTKENYINMLKARNNLLDSNIIYDYTVEYYFAREVFYIVS